MPSRPCNVRTVPPEIAARFASSDPPEERADCDLCGSALDGPVVHVDATARRVVCIHCHALNHTENRS